MRMTVKKATKAAKARAETESKKAPFTNKLQGQIDPVKKLQTVETINNKSFLKNLLNIK